MPVFCCHQLQGSKAEESSGILSCYSDTGESRPEKSCPATSCKLLRVRHYYPDKRLKAALIRAPEILSKILEENAFISLFARPEFHKHDFAAKKTMGYNHEKSTEDIIRAYR
jgi:hypothetical protein